jgi:hypothetical protein
MSTNKENRRSFLKKAAYVAPVVLAMGPLSAQAVKGTSVIAVQAGAGKDDILVNKPNGATVTITTNPSGTLTNFNNFLHRKH